MSGAKGGRAIRRGFGGLQTVLSFSRDLLSSFRVGIAARLGLAFASVAMLVVAANLFAEHGLTLASLTSESAKAPNTNSSRWVREAVSRASGAVSESIDR